MDGTGTVASVETTADGVRVRIEAAPELLRYCVEKGSITVDGVSLTVAAVDDTGFEVALIPHTLEVTTLGELTAGDDVNLETDVLAKYVESPRPGRRRLPAGGAGLRRRLTSLAARGSPSPYVRTVLSGRAPRATPRSGSELPGSMRP